MSVAVALPHCSTEDLKKRWACSPGKDQFGQRKKAIALPRCVSEPSGVRCLPIPEPFFSNVSTGLPNAKSNKYSSVLLQCDLALIFETMLFEMICFIFQYLFFKTLFCFLNPDFSRVLGQIPESSFPFSSFVHSLKEVIPQVSAPALVPSNQETPLPWCLQ